MKRYTALACLAILIVACSPTKQLYNWKGYDDAVYAYTKNSDEKSTESLIKLYNKLIGNSGGTRKTPPPGVCADCGYLLIKKGETDKGKELLVKETLLYPESKSFIDRILIRFEK